MILRRARGYAPLPVMLEEQVPMAASRGVEGSAHSNRQRTVVLPKKPGRLGVTREHAAS
jgi:hypothetical protein